MSLSKSMTDHAWNCSVCGKDVDKENEEYALLECSACSAYALHSGCGLLLVGLQFPSCLIAPQRPGSIEKTLNLPYCLD
jgi:hypothetical protein